MLAIADEFGEIKKNYTYDAYGKEQLFSITPQGENTLALVWKAETERIYNPFRYCGEYADSETGMIYLRNRYYDPDSGRFITEDPAKDGLNWYVYCGGNPVNRIDPTGLVSKDAASKIIKRNVKYIKNAGLYYKVNPSIIAACIYTEQVMNVNFIDTLTDVPGYFIDTSIGIGQVKVSTAKMLEDRGYIAPTTLNKSYAEWHTNWYSNKNIWYAPAYGNIEGSREKAIAYRLTVESENVNYVAAYLAYWQERWKNAYSQIDGKTDILATLFNQGERNEPHSNPKANKFGKAAKKEYAHMQELLGLK